MNCFLKQLVKQKKFCNIHINNCSVDLWNTLNFFHNPSLLCNSNDYFFSLFEDFIQSWYSRGTFIQWWNPNEGDCFSIVKSIWVELSAWLKTWWNGVTEKMSFKYITQPRGVSSIFFIGAEIFSSAFYVPHIWELFSSGTVLYYIKYNEGAYLEGAYAPPWFDLSGADAPNAPRLYTPLTQPWQTNEIM